MIFLLCIHPFTNFQQFIFIHCIKQYYFLISYIVKPIFFLCYLLHISINPIFLLVCFPK